MIRLYEDLDDGYLSYLVCDEYDHHGRWCQSVSEAAGKYLARSGTTNTGENPHIQDNITCDEYGSIEELRLMMLLEE